MSNFVQCDKCGVQEEQENKYNLPDDWRVITIKMTIGSRPLSPNTVGKDLQLCPKCCEEYAKLFPTVENPTLGDQFMKFVEDIVQEIVDNQ